MPEVKPSNNSPIVGIDLGTTNSLVAYTRDGKPEVLVSREGRRLIPSVVSFAGVEPVIGYAAKSKKIIDAEHTVFSVKRLLGRGFEDLKEASGRLPYKIVPGEGSGAQEGVARIDAGGRTYTAVEISAMILREVRKAAEEALGQPVYRAVLTVPAYFNDSQRQATRAAGRLAGLEIVRIVNEPTAAALAYGLDRKREGLIAVYDLGGGTFDLSILRLRDGIFEVLATHGHTALGGDDLDRAIARVAAQEIEQKFGLKPFEDLYRTAALIEESENIKNALSERGSATLNLMLDAAKGWHYSRVFTREEFDRLARPVLEPTRQACEIALRDAGLKASDISDVVMVGGPTRLKVVQDFAREIFGREPNTSMHPDEVVALGAAIQADILAGNNTDLLLLDVVPLSLGIETYGGLLSPLIKRNTRIPTSAREVFTNYADNQTGVDIHVLQGERDRIEDNRSLARFKLKGIPPMPAGLARIEVTFLIDADGILQVAAKDLKTGNEQSIEVRPTFGLTEAEISGMVQSSEVHLAEDESYRKLVEARNDADPVLRGCEKNLGAAFRLLPVEEARNVETRVESLRVAMNGSDPESIRQAAFQLDQASRRLADMIVAEALSSQKH